MTEQDRGLVHVTIADPPYTAFVQFIGITQHNLYHAGQIALLKRALQRALERALDRREPAM